MLIELKNPADLNANIWKAFDQIQTYKEQIADVFRTNEVLVISDMKVRGTGWAERIDLLQQVADLRDTVSRLEMAQASLDPYKLHEVASGKFLYKYTRAGEDTVDHFACPSCFNAGGVTVLQSSQTGSKQTYYFCQTSNFKLYVGPSDPPRPLRSSAFSTREW